MSKAAVRHSPPPEIPVVDIAPLRAGADAAGADAAGVGKALHSASKNAGFIYIVNHGVPGGVIAAARAQALDFFRSGESEKQTVAVSAAHRGFLGRGGAKMQDGLKPDIKESFIWGYEDGGGAPPDDHPLRGRNLWPAFAPGLRTAAMDYFHCVHSVAERLMRGFALGLDLPADVFLRSGGRPLSRASFVYYPPVDETGGEPAYGAGPHTDFGVLTVLCQDSAGGLEVESLDGAWIPAPPVPGALVVNVGDLLARWTNGLYRSTPHRVINRSGRERLSLVLAYDPEPQTVIDARDILGPGCAVTEPPVTCGDYLTWRFKKAFSYRNADAP